MATNNLKILLEEASVKLSCAVNDMEDLTISKNHKINILDVLEELKIVKKLIIEAQFSTEQNRLIEY
jgi:hypothetical protein